MFFWFFLRTYISASPHWTQVSHYELTLLAFWSEFNISSRCSSIFLNDPSPYSLSLQQSTLKSYPFDIKPCELTLLAYLSEFNVSSKLTADGLMQLIIHVLALPPKESLRMRVILESLYGMWDPLLFGSLKALMTLPKESRPLLMYTDSVTGSNHY